jgi:site-specific DNA-methyltransferase (adenine-specific)
MLKPYYKAGRFILYKEDCLKVLSEMKDNSVDLIFADPPYFLSNGTVTCHAGRAVSVKKADWDMGDDVLRNFEFHLEWIRACKRVLKPNATIWISGTYHSIYQCGYALQLAGYHILNDIAWFKPNASPNLSCRYFTASHETLIWAKKDRKAKHTFHYDLAKNGSWPEDQLKRKDRQMRSVWSIITPNPAEKIFGKYPTQKPFDILKRIILLASNEGDLVLELFTRSPTAEIAVARLGRRFLGIDASKFPAYKNQIKVITNEGLKIMDFISYENNFRNKNC